MFYAAINFNQLLNFDTSEVTNMSNMFYEAISFNQPLNFDISSVINMKRMFYYAKEFTKKYNNDHKLSNETDDIKEWFNFNRERMNDIDIKEEHGEEINNFFNKLQTNSIQKKEIQWH